MSDKGIATDLHGHSIYSDATATPEDFVRFRVAKRFSVIALTDHDTFAGVARATKAAAGTGVVVVPAMETTSFIHFGTEYAEQIHVLAYFPPAFLDDGRLAKTALAQRAQKVHARWKQFALAWIDELDDNARARLDVESWRALPDSEFPGLQLVINRIVEKSEPLFGEFHRHHVRFWTHDKELFGWSPEALIETIRNDGGLDVVAHPNRVRDKARMSEVLDVASGIEVYTSRHRPEIARAFRERAERTGKHWTASSDDHQNATYIRPPEGTPARTVERILRGA
jgi:predicted metal-dependent phosphoesterase TrpH